MTALQNVEFVVVLDQDDLAADHFRKRVRPIKAPMLQRWDATTTSRATEMYCYVCVDASIDVCKKYSRKSHTPQGGYVSRDRR